MKIGKEYVLAIIGGLFLLAHVLQSGVTLLSSGLNSPYAFLNSNFFQTYPFTTAIIFIRGLALFIFPLWALSFFESASMAKGGLLLLTSGLMQLYAIQQVVTSGKMVTMEWSLALTVGGLALLLPTVLFFIKGMLHSAHQKIAHTPNPFQADSVDDEDDD